jgi:hypothetical protein
MVIRRKNENERECGNKLELSKATSPFHVQLKITNFLVLFSFDT